MSFDSESNNESSLQWQWRLNNLNIQRKVVYYADYTMARTSVLSQPINIFMDPLYNFFRQIFFSK